MKFSHALFFLLLISSVSWAQAIYPVSKQSEDSLKLGAQEPPAVQYANTITQADLEKHLSVLASDEFEGRETGTPGQKKAAKYIADQFAALKLPEINGLDAYFQPIYFIAENWRDIKMEVNGEEMRHLWDFYAYPSTNANHEKQLFEEITFLGYGIDDEAYSDYRGVDVNGKTIMVYAGEPFDKKGRSLLTGSKEASSWSDDWRKKIRTAKDKGVAAVLIIDPDFKNNVAQARKKIIDSQLHLGKGEEAEINYANNYFITTSLAQKIIGDQFKRVVKARKKIKKSGRSKPIGLSCQWQIAQQKRARSLFGENVLGFVEGTDEGLKDEIVIVTAHYDHLGKRNQTVYNGADDNGSGTSAVLEIAEAFAKAKNAGVGPRRSVLLMLVSGEEKGLLGSEYYAKTPVFPMENTIANVNVDMIGRVDEKHEGNPNYIYVIGADRLSTDLHQINEEMNARYTQLELDYTYNAENDPNRFYYRSDHYNFASLGVPAIFYFSGVHRDYHRSTDDVEKIDFGKMEKIARLIFHTAWELANRDERIKVDVSKGE